MLRALVLFGLGVLLAVPAAAEQEEHTYSKVDKTLKMLGLDSPGMQRFADDMEARVDDGHFHFMREKTMGGEFSIRYKLKGGVGADQAEIRFSPDDSPVHYSVTKEHALVGYSLRF